MIKFVVYAPFQIVLPYSFRPSSFETAPAVGSTDFNVEFDSLQKPHSLLQLDWRFDISHPSACSDPEDSGCLHIWIDRPDFISHIWQDYQPPNPASQS